MVDTSFIIFECENCGNTKIVRSRGFLSEISCSCEHPITRLYSLFKDGRICKIYLKGDRV